MKETFGQTILRLRKQKSFTQEQLAEKLGVTAQAVSKWENDVSMPDIQTLPLIAEVFGVSTDELFGIKQSNIHNERYGDNEDNEDNGNGINIHFHGFTKKVFAFPIMLILTGLIYILSTTGIWPYVPPQSFWSILWPSMLFAFGISLLVNSFSIFSAGITLCGAYYILFNLNIIYYELSWPIVLSVMIILLGISIIVDNTILKAKKHNNIKKGASRITVDETNGECNMSCSFGSCEQKIESSIFKNANASVSFGNGILILSNCQSAAQKSTIQAHVSFGELEIRCPGNMKIISRVNSSFASVDVVGNPNDDAEYIIELYGNVSFGCIKIIYE